MDGVCDKEKGQREWYFVLRCVQKTSTGSTVGWRFYASHYVSRKRTQEMMSFSIRASSVGAITVFLSPPPLFLALPQASESADKKTFSQNESFELTNLLPSVGFHNVEDASNLSTGD